MRSNIVMDVISGAVHSALVIVPRTASAAAMDPLGPETAPMLSTLDQIITLAAILVVVWTPIVWGGRGRRDPFRHAPLRPNHFREESILLAVCVYLLAAVVLSGVVGLLIDDPNGVRGRLMIGNGAQLCGITACLFIADRRFQGGARRFAFGLPQARWDRVVALVFFASLAAIGLCPWIGEATVWVIRQFVRSYEVAPHPTIQALREGSQPAWVVAGLWIGAVVVAPIAEEVFFRGLLQTFLAGVVRSRWLAIGLASAVFGIVHFSQPHVIPALIALGVLIGYAYERTGTLVVPVLIHAAFNLKTLIWEALGTPAG